MRAAGADGGVLAGAVALTANGGNAQRIGESVPDVDGTDGAIRPSVPTPPATRPAPPTSLASIVSELSERDWKILDTVRRHRFATTAQLTTLHFSSITPSACASVARRVLARLRRLGLLDTLTRRVGGVRAGSSGLVHYLSARGDRLLRHEHNQRRRRFHEPSQTFLRHTLAVGDIHVALATAEQRGELELVAISLEGAAWRHFHAGLTVATLKPDAYCEVAVPPESSELLTAFIEVDLGTEHVPTLRRKCQQYAAYAASSEAADTGMPLVVWSLTARDPAVAEQRRAQLRAAIERDRTLDSEMFRITSPDQLIAALLTAARQEGDTP